MKSQAMTAAIAAILVAVSSNANASPSLTGNKIGDVFASPQTIEVRIGREFPAFDTDFSGELDHYEFSKWLNPLAELRLKYDEISADRSEIDAFIDTSFVAADDDENGEVSQRELAIFFGADVD